MNKKPHIPYYRQLLDQTKLSERECNFYTSVLDSIEKRGGVPTVKQQLILHKIKSGY